MTTDRESALYYLVWHKGFDLTDAEDILNDAPSAIPELAELGRTGFMACARGLCRLIDSLNNVNDIEFSA